MGVCVCRLYVPILVMRCDGDDDGPDYDVLEGLADCQLCQGEKVKVCYIQISHVLC